MNFNTLCLSGGGIKGFIIIGALKKCIELDILNLNYINNFYGTSVGTILNFFLILGYKVQEIEQLLCFLNFEKLEPDFDLDTFLSELGIDNGEKINTFLKTVLYFKLNQYDITLKELFNITGKKFYIITYNYTNNVEELISHENYPNLSVVLAIRMSISVPIIFTPVKYNNCYYIDGGIKNNFGINYCDIEKTLGICIETIEDTTDLNILTYLGNIFNIIFNSMQYRHNINYDKVIKIKFNKDIFIDYHFDLDQKKKLINFGYNYVNNYVKNNVYFFALIYVKNILKSIKN